MKKYLTPVLMITIVILGCSAGGLAGVITRQDVEIDAWKQATKPLLIGASKSVTKNPNPYDLAEAIRLLPAKFRTPN